MATLQDSESALNAASSRLSGYTADLPSDINKQITEAWSPTLKEASRAVGDQVSNFLPNYFKIPFEGLMAGTGAEHASPQYKLQQMGKGYGDLVGELDNVTRYADYLGAKKDEMYDKAMEAMRFGYQADADAYGREFQKYQLAWEAAEAEKQRQFQASQAAADRSMQTDWNSLLGQSMGQGAAEMGADGLEVPEDEYNKWQTAEFMNQYGQVQPQTQGFGNNLLSKAYGSNPFIGAIGGIGSYLTGNLGQYAQDVSGTPTGKIMSLLGIK